MGVRAAGRTSARAAEPSPDVLASGPDEPPWRPARGHVRVAAALAAAAVAALVVPAALPGDGRQVEDAVEVALREGSAALPRRDAAPVEDRVRGGVHVEVVNEGRVPVRLVSATLTPGQWQASVVDDVDANVDPGGRGRLLRPGWAAVLVLHRGIVCSPGADHGPRPTSLVLDLEVDGRADTRTLELGGAQAAYDGALQDLLGAPAAFCPPGGAPAAAGTVGDPGRPFLPLWPAGTGVLPDP